MKTKSLILTFWVTLALGAVAYIAISTISTLSTYSELVVKIANSDPNSTFYDCELLTNPAYVGFLKGFLGGIFLDPSYTDFIPNDPLLKVNYSQEMANLLVPHTKFAFLFGQTSGVGLSIFIGGGVLAMLFSSKVINRSGS